MKSTLTLTLLTILFISNTIAQDSKAPKPIFIVETTMEKFFVTEGEDFEVDASAQATVVSVKLAPHRKFEIPSISFHYPSDFGYQFEGSSGYKNWTLDGNNFVVMLFELDGGTALGSFVDEIVSQFGRENCELKSTMMRVGDKMLTGTRIAVSLVGQSLTLDFLEIEASAGKSRFLAFQDTLTQEGSMTEEAGKTIKMINTTMIYK